MGKDRGRRSLGEAEDNLAASRCACCLGMDASEHRVPNRHVSAGCNGTVACFDPVSNWGDDATWRSSVTQPDAPATPDLPDFALIAQYPCLPLSSPPIPCFIGNGKSREPWNRDQLRTPEPSKLIQSTSARARARPTTVNCRNPCGAHDAPSSHTMGPCRNSFLVASPCRTKSQHLQQRNHGGPPMHDGTGRLLFPERSATTFSSTLHAGSRCVAASLASP